MTPYPQTPSDGIEWVVLLDEDGCVTGTEDKQIVHDSNTRLHLAFSCYVFDAGGRLLVTQRALGKRTWPGVWTNTLCGHPAPGEGVVGAVRRRAGQELGIGIDDPRMVLPRFRYRAVMANGTVENEMCPVLVAWTSEQPAPDPAEVAGSAWVEWPGFKEDVLSARRDVSPWCFHQVVQLALLGDDPRTWPATPPSALPPAVQAS